MKRNLLALLFYALVTVVLTAPISLAPHRLAANEGEPNFPIDVIEALSLYWRGDTEGVARRAEDSRHFRNMYTPY